MWIEGAIRKVNFYVNNHNSALLRSTYSEGHALDYFVNSLPGGHSFFKASCHFFQLCPYICLGIFLYAKVNAPAGWQKVLAEFVLERIKLTVQPVDLFRFVSDSPNDKIGFRRWLWCAFHCFL